MTQLPYKPEDVVHKECRFVTYVHNPSQDEPDLHVTKEILHMKDGTKVPNLKFLYDHQRSFFITKKGFRNHKQHKEWEKIERLSTGRSPERFLVGRIASALGEPWFRGNKRKLFESPYIYGVDISSCAVIKHEYMVKYPGNVTPYSVAELDIETDMVNEETLGHPIMSTLSMKDKMITAVVRSYLKGYANVEERIQELSRQYLGEHITARGIKPELVIVENDMEMWRVMFKAAHEWQPDFLSIWNMEFEMDRLMESCDRHSVDPASIVCDPSVPERYRAFEYKKGKPQKVTASGKVMPIPPAGRWHTVTCPASFYIIDQMCVYKQTRMGKQEQASYSLNAILSLELKTTKLYIKTEGNIQEGTADWHYYMQKHNPLEYVVYNQFDCIGPELLDEKVKDLAMVMPSMAKTSDFARFPSQPRRTCDDLHWEIQEMGLMMGVSSSALADEHDEITLSRLEWIITLKAALIADNGLKIIEELPDSNSKCYGFVGDLDISAAYPNGESALNTSKETTIRELTSIEGIDEDVFRMQNMGLSAGHVNAVDYCVTMFGFPEHKDMLAAFLEDTATEPT